MLRVTRNDTEKGRSAALAVVDLAIDRFDHIEIATAIARGLSGLIDCDGVAVFFANGRDFELYGTAGPRARAMRRHWQDGRIALRGGRYTAAASRPDRDCAYRLYPMKAGGRAMGVVAVAATRWDGAQTAQVRAFLKAVSGPLERSLLAHEVRAASLAAAQSSDLDSTLQAILAGVRRVVPADAASVLVRDGDYARVIAIDGHPPEALGHLLPVTCDRSLYAPLVKGEPIRLAALGAEHADAPAGANRIKGYMGVPLPAGEAIVGVLCVDSWRENAFTDEDLRRACQFAAHVGAAVARARTYSLTLAEVSVLREAALLATHDPGSTDIVPRILDGLRRVVRCDGASVLLRDGPYARVAATHGHPQSILGYGLEIDGHESLEAPLLRGRPFLTPDLGAFPNYERVAGVLEIRGHLAVPLVSRGEILGQLAVDSLRWGAFGLEDVSRVELFAGFVAAALVNSHMHVALKQAAECDPVTGLYNHRAIHDLLDRALARARDDGRSVAVAMLDLDGFKLYNDTHGHPAGDAALQTVAGALIEACRADDAVGRYGGDEFLVVIPDLSPHESWALGARLRDAVAARTMQPTDSAALPLRVSVGVATYPGDGEDRDVLVACADARLYESKNRGEVIAPDMREGSSTHVGDAFSVLDALVTTVDRKDRYTRAHSEEVTRLALMLGRELGLSPETLRSVRLAGLLHDVGKIGVPDRILKKPGRLTQDEIEVMNTHPVLGEAIVAGLPDLAEIRTGVRSHHERWDGAGYPDSLRGEEIPLLGRLLAVPDCYSAMTSDRPYRAALLPEVALAEIKRGAGRQFDPQIAGAFIRAMKRLRVPASKPA